VFMVTFALIVVYVLVASWADALSWRGLLMWSGGFAFIALRVWHQVRREEREEQRHADEEWQRAQEQRRIEDERHQRVQEARYARRLAAAQRRAEQGGRAGRAREPFQDTREGTSAISRAQARQIAQDYATAHGRSITITEEAFVSDLDDLARRGVRSPALYAVDLKDAWIVYARERRAIIQSSTIVAVSKTTGEVLYAGSAHDEG
jgi:hypothetical protein